MAATTAIIFVGSAHPNDDGLRPEGMIEFIEGDSPAFIFPRRLDRRPTDRELRRPMNALVVIPTLENMLDDLMLFIAFKLVGAASVSQTMHQYCGRFVEQAQRFEMYGDLTPEQRQDLYQKVKKLEDFPKVGVCLFTGSELARTVSHIKEYSMEYEVCEPSLTNISSRW